MAKKSKQVQQASASAKAASKDAAEGASTTTARTTSASKSRREARKQEFAKQQKQWLYTKIAIGAVAAILIGALAWGAWGQYKEWQVSRDVTTYFSASDFVGQHYEDGPILYEQIPPVGGMHRGLWQNCGFYAGYIDNTRGVHALEHGAVWITYDPDLPQDQIDHLKDLTNQQFILVSPYPGMDSPVVASVWGKQIKLDGAFDDRLDAFISRYRKNPENSPEPNGICWSGVSSTTEEVPQQEPFVQANPDADPIGGISAVDATATAQAQNPPAATPTEAAGTGDTASPAATPAASPGATPGSTPVASPEATPAAS